MNDVLVTSIVLMFGIFVLLVVLRRSLAWESPLLIASFMAHLASSFVMILVTVYFFGGGDMLAYYNNGLIYAELLSLDFTEYAPDLLRYILRRPAVQHQFFLSGSSTGSMMGLSAVLMFLLGGSLYATSALISIFSFLSKLLIYKGFCMSLPSRYHKRALFAAMLLPSAVFWSSGLLKEPIALLGLGPAFFGLAHVVHGRLFLGVALTLLGALPMALVKPYILFPLLLCGALWFYCFRALTTRGQIAILKQPVYLVFSLLLAFASLQLLGALFPEFGVDNLAEEAAGLQEIGQRVRGGSHYAITAAPTRSLLGQIAIAPIGLAFALFRPLPFDVRNPVILLGAIEMMGVLWLWWRSLRLRPIRHTLRLILSSPLLIFCVAFCIIFGAAVGLSSTNIGTLSRYRVPMLPFYALALLILSMPSSDPRRVRAPSPIREV